MFYKIDKSKQTGSKDEIVSAQKNPGREGTWYWLLSPKFYINVFLLVGVINLGTFN